MSQKKIFRICALIMAFSGITILIATFYPIISYEWESAKKYPILISPLVDEETASFKFEDTDYTQASNWFVDEKMNETKTERVRYFTITIPKLKIENATVTIGGEDLSETLIQYAGTTVPGKIGNSVIFGHSILPTYYDPTNYLAIFSTLPTLDKGDEIYINYDDIYYEYQVESMFEVKPEDIQIMEQNTNSSYITLVTCTPPGHPLKPRRLVVRAKLVPN